MRKLILAGLTAAVAVALAAPAWAWTASASATSKCAGTTGTVNYGDEPGTHTAIFTFDGETKTETVNAAGGGTITFHFGSHAGGAWSYKGTWSESSEVETASGTLKAAEGCEEEQTPPTTIKPPVDKPEKPRPQVGTPVHRTRTPAYTPTPAENAPPDHHGPPVKPAPKPGKLPFTGAGEQAAMLVAGFALVAGGVLLVRKVRLN